MIVIPSYIPFVIIVDMYKYTVINVLVTIDIDTNQKA